MESKRLREGWKRGVAEEKEEEEQGTNMAGEGYHNMHVGG
jgi:hypothetical protein